MEKKKLRIGIDIDEVIVKFTEYFLDFCKKKGLNPPLFEEIDKYHLHSFFNMAEEEIYELYKEFNKTKENVEFDFIPFAKESINELSKNHELIIITARQGYLQEYTFNFFKKHFPNINFNIIFTGDIFGGKKNKNEVCVEKNIDYLIEDRRKIVKDCAEAGVKSFLLDKPWSQNCEHDNIIRVKDWNEILEKIKEFENGLYKTN